MYPLMPEMMASKEGSEKRTKPDQEVPDTRRALGQLKTPLSFAEPYEAGCEAMGEGKVSALGGFDDV